MFNVIHREAGRYYYFNSVSTAVFSLDPAQHEFARNCLAEIEAKGRCSSAAIEELLAQGSFLVPRYHDEYEDEHQRFLEVKRREDWAFLSIAPTFSCNLRCDYCFQAGRQGPRVLMDPKVAQCLAALFEELAERVQAIAVLWFGGEPLLALSRIEQLTRIFRRTCEKRGVRYRAEMMTNGSLLNEHTLLRLRDLSLHKLEISIDGLPESYSRRKGLPLRQALGFYEFLVRNADRVLDAVKSLVVRINVDRQNLAEAREIVGRMRHQCEAAGRIDFRLQFLGEGRGAECIPHACYARSETPAVRAEFERFLAAEGLEPHGGIRRLEHPCMAVRKYAFTVDPDGGIGRCVPATGQAGEAALDLCADGRGSMLDRLTAMETPYASFDPFVNGPCKNCAYLPVCLGQCPRDYGSDQFVCVRKDELNSRLPLQEEQSCGPISV